MSNPFFICRGNIIYAGDRNRLTVHEDSYLVVKDGIVEGIYPVLPEQYASLEVKDYGRGLIIPAFTDLHVHAPQYVQRGIGMDVLLSDWLNQYTFPQEARFADMEYAKNVYDAFVDDLIRQGTFHTAIFATIHREATDYLFARLEEKGLYAFVGKVNMDVHSPDCLCETTEESLRETRRYLESHTSCTTVKPILTPRFAPTCSRELMHGLGKLSREFHCGLHTHLVESKWEAAEALRLFPECRSDAEIYEQAGLLENGPSILAHVIFPSEEDVRILKKYHGVSVHCPDATTNIIAGIMPTAALQDQDLAIALGSDVGGGHQLAIYRQVSRAVQMSKLKGFYEPENNRAVSFAHAFYLATKAGGSVFGNVGSLEKGYRFNALVIESMEDKGLTLSPEERLERFCYTGDDRNIVARYLSGVAVE